MFSEGNYATVWAIRPVKDNVVEIRITTSKKNKSTNLYEVDFSGFVSVFNSSLDNAKDKILALSDGKEIKFSGKEAPRIKLGRVGVTRTYDVESKKDYTNFLMFSCSTDGNNSNNNAPKKAQQANANKTDNGFINVPFGTEEELPFC